MDNGSGQYLGSQVIEFGSLPKKERKTETRDWNSGSKTFRGSYLVLLARRFIMKLGENLYCEMKYKYRVMSVACDTMI